MSSTAPNNDPRFSGEQPGVEPRSPIFVGNVVHELGMVRIPSFFDLPEEENHFPAFVPPAFHLPPGEELGPIPESRAYAIPETVVTTNEAAPETRRKAAAEIIIETATELERETIIETESTVRHDETETTRLHAHRTGLQADTLFSRRHSIENTLDGPAESPVGNRPHSPELKCDPKERASSPPETEEGEETVPFTEVLKRRRGIEGVCVKRSSGARLLKLLGATDETDETGLKGQEDEPQKNEHSDMLSRIENQRGGIRPDTATRSTAESTTRKSVERTANFSVAPGLTLRDDLHFSYPGKVGDEELRIARIDHRSRTDTKIVPFESVTDSVTDSDTTNNEKPAAPDIHVLHVEESVHAPRFFTIPKSRKRQEPIERRKQPERQERKEVAPDPAGLKIVPSKNERKIRLAPPCVTNAQNREFVARYPATNGSGLAHPAEAGFGWRPLPPCVLSPCTPVCFFRPGFASPGSRRRVDRSPRRFHDSVSPRPEDVFLQGIWNRPEPEIRVEPETPDDRDTSPRPAEDVASNASPAENARKMRAKWNRLKSAFSPNAEAPGKFHAGATDESPEIATQDFAQRTIISHNRKNCRDEDGSAKEPRLIKRVLPERTKKRHPGKKAERPVAPMTSIVEEHIVVERPVERTVEEHIVVERPVERIVEEHIVVERPVERIVEEHIVVEQPVERIVEEHIVVEQPVERIVEEHIVVERPVEQIVIEEPMERVMEERVAEQEDRTNRAVDQESAGAVPDAVPPRKEAVYPSYYGIAVAWPETCDKLYKKATTHFRSLETMLAQQARQERRIVAFCGYTPRAGTTTLLLGVARALAERKRRTLLIDLNLHNPELLEQFGLSTDQSWEQLFLPETMDRCDGIPPLLRLEPSGVFLLPLARENLEAADRFIGEYDVSAIIRHMLEWFDHILIDAGHMSDQDPEEKVDLLDRFGTEGLLFVHNTKSETSIDYFASVEQVAPPRPFLLGVAENRAG